MNRNRYAPFAGLLAAALLWLLPQGAFAQETARSFEDVQRGLPAVVEAPLQMEPAPAVSKTATLTFYTSRPTFEADFPVLTEEDFEGSNFPPVSVGTCAGPIDSGASGCYPAGELVDGFELGGFPIGDIAILTTGFLGVTSTVAGPNFFSDDSFFNFTGPDDVFAAGFEVLAPFGAETFDIEIFGPSGSLGTTTHTSGTTTGTFFGVASDGDPIVRIEITGGTGSSAELFDNLAFGGKIEADLWIEKDVDVNFDTNPPTGSYHIHVQNHGPADATNVFVQDGLSSALTVLDWQETQGTFDPFSGGWTVGDLAAGAEAELWIDVRFDATGEYCNLAWAEADEDDPDPSNNNVELCILLQGEREAPDFVAGQGPGRIIERGGSRFFADLALTKTVDDATPSVGENVTYTLTVTNLGPQSTARVEVTDHLPECLALVGTDPAGVYDNWFWSVGKLRVGESKTLKITATVTAACQGTVTNFAEVTASSLPDPDDRFRGFRDPPEQDEEAEASFTVSAAASKASSQPRLLRNYPNPFNPETVVPFELVERTAVSLKVYDLLGRLVETLVEGELSAGVHEVIFRAGELPTGVYLVRLEAGGWVSTQRMTLMK